MIFKAHRIMARLESSVIDEASRFWASETGTGGSFYIGLEEGDVECLDLLDDLMTNKVATVCISDTGVMYGGSTMQVEADEL